MILKVNELTPEQFVSLASFLASDKNIIKDALTGKFIVMHDNSQLRFARLTTSESTAYGEHNVVLELVEAFLEKKNVVPARYLLELMQAMGRFPE